MRLGIYDEETSGNKPVWSSEQVATVREALPLGCGLDEEKMAWWMESDQIGVGEYVHALRSASRGAVPSPAVAVPSSGAAPMQMTQAVRADDDASRAGDASASIAELSD